MRALAARQHPKGTPTLRRLVFSFVGLALLAACGAHTVTDPSEIVGVYTLRSIDGQPPPQVVTPDGTQLIGGRITLSRDRIFHQEFDLRRGSDPAVTVHSFGTYDWRGDRITVTPTPHGGEPFTLAISGSTLTVQGDRILVYER